MKKYIYLLVISLALLSTDVKAQFRAGLIGGMNVTEARLKNVSKGTDFGYVVGLTGSWDLPAGFSLQPSLLFNSKAAYFTDQFNLRNNYFEVPVSLQWGPELRTFRPFVDVTPFIGFHLSNKGRLMEDGEAFAENVYMYKMQRFEYGVGVGGGIDVWKLRMVLRYGWNFGPIFSNDIKDNLLDFEGDNFKGLTLALSFFFI